MAKHGYRTWCEVSLDALNHNFQQFKQFVSADTKIMGVVKADAYGHGVAEVSHLLEAAGADFLAVACLDEAIELRRGGITLPILILGYTPARYSATMVEQDIIPTVYHYECAQALSQAAAAQNKLAKIHVKIDTGMSRIGYCYNENERENERTVEEIMALAQLPRLEIEGIFTHFACADEEDTTLTERQFRRFCHLLSRLEDRGLHIPLRHACNSAATMRFPHMHLDMVRVGISLYGLYPSELSYPLSLRPAMQLKTAVSHIKTVEAGEGVSYGAIYHTDKPTRIATIPIGYADGFSRILSGRANTIVNGCFAPVVGRICMDQCMIDVSAVNTIHMEDEVVLFGTQDGLTIPIEQVASAIGTINYELLCVIGRRIPRCYTQQGQLVEVHNYLIS